MATHQITRDEARFYICSLSPSTIVYKGQFTSDQLWTYFIDFQVKYFTYVIKDCLTGVLIDIALTLSILYFFYYLLI